MTELIDTTEMYLRTILELEEVGIPALRARIVERLGHSGPTVSQTVARMERDGLLTVDPDRSIVLSEEGRLRAVRVMRKHRLAERLLVDVIGLEYEYVHAEACRWEHVISERAERKIVALLSEHESSPYGNPIPGLTELGLDEKLPLRETVVPLAKLDPTEPYRVVLRRIGEQAQDDEGRLAEMATSGIVPGSTVTVGRDGYDDFTITHEGLERTTTVTIGRTAAAHVFVSMPRL